MNRIYRNVWNAAVGAFVAAPETSKARSNGSSGRMLATLSLAVMAAIAATGMPAIAFAAEPGFKVTDQAGNVVSGNNCTETIYGANGVAIGCGSQIGTASARVAGGVALGYLASVTGNNSVAIGANSVADQNNTVSVGVVNGERRITNVASGINATDAANMSQLNAVSATANKGWNLSANGEANGQNIAPGASANFAAGRNVEAERSGNTITYSIVKAPTFDGMVTANGGLTLGVGQTVDMGGNRVTNVGSGTEDSDAVNFAQLKEMKGSAANVVLYDTDAKSVVTLKGNTGTAITNLAPGTVSPASSDAVNGSQLYAMSDSVSGALGAGSVVAKNGVVTAPSYTLSHADGITRDQSGPATNVGGGFAKVDAALGALDNSIHTNTQNIAGNTTAITNLDGRVTNVEGNILDVNGKLDHVVSYDSQDRDTVTLRGVSGTRITNLAAGSLSEDSTDAVNGAQLYATNQQVSKNTNSITDLSSSITNGAIGLVRQNPTTRDITVANNTDGTQVDFTGTAGSRRLTGVADGVIAPSSLHAVNGGQLYGMGQSMASAFGGGAGLDSSGNFIGPSYTVGGVTYSNVGDALGNVDTRVTHVEKSVSTINTQINNGEIGLVKQDSSTGTVTVAADKGGEVVDMTGTDGTRKVTGVADGDISATSTDAVNGSQIHSLAEQVGAVNTSVSVHAQTIQDTEGRANAYADQKASVALQSANAYTDRRVNAVRRDASSGTAAAMAMAGLPQAVQYGRNLVALSGATYDGQSAIALGLSRVSGSGRWVFKGTAAANTRGYYGVAVGAGMQW